MISSSSISGMNNHTYDNGSRSPGRLGKTIFVPNSGMRASQTYISPVTPFKTVLVDNSISCGRCYV